MTNRRSPIFRPDNTWLWVGGIMLFVGLPFFAAGLYAAFEAATLEERFQKEASVARGTLLTKEVRKSAKSGEVTYSTTYRYARAGEQAENSGAVVSKAAWAALQEGEAVEVRYLPGWTRRLRIAGQVPEEKFWLAVIFVAVGGLLSAGGFFAVGKTFARRRTIARLRVEGQLAKAQVIEVAPAALRINNEQQISVRYSYRDARGVEHRGDVTLSPGEARRWSPEKTGYIRYDAARPDVHAWLGESTQ